ncbi:hypothetical protein D7V93_21425, partial [Corallococcus llansteffanensis]
MGCGDGDGSGLLRGDGAGAMVTGTQTLFLGFMSLLIAERLLELVLSKRNAARAFARGGVET